MNHNLNSENTFRRLAQLPMATHAPMVCLIALLLTVQVTGAFGASDKSCGCTSTNIFGSCNNQADLNDCTSGSSRLRLLLGR